MTASLFQLMWELRKVSHSFSIKAKGVKEQKAIRDWCLDCFAAALKPPLILDWEESFCINGGKQLTSIYYRHLRCLTVSHQGGWKVKPLQCSTLGCLILSWRVSGQRWISKMELEIIGSSCFTRNLAENIQVGCTDGRQGLELMLSGWAELVAK